MTGAIVAASAVALAACSSAPRASGSSGASSSGSNSSTVAATTAVRAATTIPTAIPVTQALPSAPPKGKTVLFLQCEEAQCAQEGQGLQAAAKAIGWTVKILNFQEANPATLVAALQQGLQYHPVAAFFSGVPQEAWQSMQKPYAAVGAVIVDNHIGSAPTGIGVVPGRGYASSDTRMGTTLAEEQIVDSGGTPSNSVFVTVSAYPDDPPREAGYKAEIAKDCPSCQVTVVDVTLPQLLGGQLIPAVVSAAKRVSNAKYIVSVNGQFIGQLPEALKAAGLGGQFKIISGAGSSPDQENVLNGTALATVNSPLIEGGWQDMDEAIRWVMHLPIPAGDQKVPWVLLIKSNIGTPADSWERPANFPQQFEQLWHVG